MMLKRFSALLLLFFSFNLYILPQGRVSETKHNLSVSGPGQFKSLDETRICIFCHTSHSARPRQPLWNHDLSAVAYYKTYKSSTLDSSLSGKDVFTPTGYSRLCLSCHDGTVAIGALRRGRSRWRSAGGIGALPATAKGFLGTDLSGSHPLSFMVTESLIAINNAKDSPLRSLAEMKSDQDDLLDENDQMQCTSCHDAHSDENFMTSGIHFWKKQDYSDVCTACHIS